MLVHWIWLATRRGISDYDKQKVLNHFRDPEDAYFARSYAGVEGLGKSALEDLADKELEPAEAVLERCKRENIRLLTLSDENYPRRLKNIADPPLVLYCKGTLPDWEDTPLIGVVGTRKASAYGLRIAKRMGYQIGRCGGIIVTGMAAGIDGAAARGALSAGQTVVGVLGCGVDQVYPASNRGLFEDVARNGCLISEYPPGTPPYKWNFPKRNRVISGVSNGVLVVEAPEKSGALITARQAVEQGRDVFVVPGNIDVASCAGSNALLRSGATAVNSGWDLLSEYQGFYPDKLHEDISPAPPETVFQELRVAQIPVIPQNKEPIRQENDKKAVDKEVPPPYSDGNTLSQEEQAVLAVLSGEPRPVDEVIAQAGLPAGTALAVLTRLQVKGFAFLLPGRQVAKISESGAEMAAPV